MNDLRTASASGSASVSGWLSIKRMVRTTERVGNQLHPLGTLWRVVGTVVLACVLLALLLAASGCTKKAPATKGNGASSDATATTSGHMAGPPVEVHIPQSAIDNAPAPWNLSSPETAVRSYLAWVTYAYRIGQSVVATPTMSASEEVRVDSYNQFNLEKSRLIEQTLKSIEFHDANITKTKAVLPVKESWTYSYLSVEEGNKSIGGPYSISYNTTYTVVKNQKGGWVVDSVQAKALGKVK